MRVNIQVDIQQKTKSSFQSNATDIFHIFGATVLFSVFSSTARFSNILLVVLVWFVCGMTK